MANGTLKVSNIETSSGSGTITLGASGETVTIASGVTQTVAVNTPAFEAKMSGNQTLSDDTQTKIQFNTEVFDSEGNYDHSTNYRFTPTTAGKYLIYSYARLESSSHTTLVQADLIIYKNGSAYSGSGINFNQNYGQDHSSIINNIIDFNGSTDYVEIYGRINVTSGTPAVVAATFTQSAAFGAYRIVGA